MRESAPLALIVDDDIDWVEILEASVALLGYDINTMPDPPHARAWLTEHRPQIIILDLLMPNGNGIDLCRWIRMQERLSNVPVVIVSGLRDDEMIERAMSLGSVDFIHKPFKLETLRLKADRLLRPPIGAPRPPFRGAVSPP